MAITTYAELQTAVGNWLMRSDLTAVIPDFITLAEAQMQRDIEHYKMEDRSQVVLTDRYTVLPSNFRKPIRLYITGANKAMEPITSSEMQDKRYSSQDGAGDPCFYTLSGGEIEIYPTPDNQSMEMTYIADIPVLSDSNTSNWLLADAPDAYLYGSLIQAAPYLDQDERLITWTALYTAAVQGLNRQSEKARWGGHKLKMRVNNGV